MLAILGAMRSLSCEVTFLPTDFRAPPAGLAQLQELGCSVLLHPRSAAQRLRSPIDVAWICRPEQANWYLPRVRKAQPDAAVVYDTIDLHEVRLKEQARHTGALSDRLRSRFVGALERRAIERADVTVLVTSDEASIVASRPHRSRLAIVPLIYAGRLDPLPSWAEREGFIFVGGGAHEPNVDAVRWIVEEIAPRLHRALPDAAVRIVGADLPASLRVGAPPNVQFLGSVPDLAALYDTTRVSLAPLRYGAGMKGKVGEAMANGLPVVTTPIGAEGYGVTDNALLIRGDVGGLVDAAVQVHTDEQIWARVADAGRAHIGEHFSSDAGRDAVQGVLQSLRRRG